MRSVGAAHEYDLLVVGGGINGAGIARDAVGRNLRVLLCEQHDLAQHTSSASSKLIHGGLRYLEYYQFKLVRKALKEREVLMRMAPHIISPLRFVMPHSKGQRPAWVIRTGLFFYDHLARREILPASQAIELAHHVAGQPLKSRYRKGFVYSDGWVDDARLVVLNALDASERGAHIMTRTKCVAARRCGEFWHAQLESNEHGQFEVCVRAIVNAAGPWTAQFADAVGGMAKSYGLRLIKGSHIVVKRLFDHPYAYIFQNPDQRVIFAIPYQNDFTLIGTTDLEYRGDVGKVDISADEVAYLCAVVNRYFTQQITAANVVWTYAGVRPLLNDKSENASAITRDYFLECNDHGAPLLNVWGGKITTYRKLAEEALAILLPRLRACAPSWTATVPLPGGDLKEVGQLVKGYDFASFLQAFCARHAWLPQALALRYARSYGSRAERLLHGATTLADLGEELTPGLYEIEARYLCVVEWANSAEDILWRRTRLGLHCQWQHTDRLQQWLAQRTSAGLAPDITRQRVVGMTR